MSHSLSPIASSLVLAQWSLYSMSDSEESLLSSSEEGGECLMCLWHCFHNGDFLPQVAAEAKMPSFQPLPPALSVFRWGRLQVCLCPVGVACEVGVSGRWGLGGRTCQGGMEGGSVCAGGAPGGGICDALRGGRGCDTRGRACSGYTLLQCLFALRTTASPGAAATSGLLCCTEHGHSEGAE